MALVGAINITLLQRKSGCRSWIFLPSTLSPRTSWTAYRPGDSSIVIIPNLGQHESGLGAGFQLRVDVDGCRPEQLRNFGRSLPIGHHDHAEA